jgi:hypothetical protein
MLGDGTLQTQHLPSALEQEYWSQGIAAFDVGDYEVAAMHFRKLGARSRPLYNVSLCYLLMNDEESSVLCQQRPFYPRLLPWKDACDVIHTFAWPISSWPTYSIAQERAKERSRIITMPSK